MDVPARQHDEGSTAERDAPESTVTSHRTRPGRLVFTERDNSDGWIATDLAVDLER